MKMIEFVWKAVVLLSIGYCLVIVSHESMHAHTCTNSHVDTVFSFFLFCFKVFHFRFCLLVLDMRLWNVSYCKYKAHKQWQWSTSWWQKVKNTLFRIKNQQNFLITLWTFRTLNDSKIEWIDVKVFFLSPHFQFTVIFMFCILYASRFSEIRCMRILVDDAMIKRLFRGNFRFLFILVFHLNIASILPLCVYDVDALIGVVFFFMEFHSFSN